MTLMAYIDPGPLTLLYGITLTKAHKERKKLEKNYPLHASLPCHLSIRKICSHIAQDILYCPTNNTL